MKYKYAVQLNLDKPTEPAIRTPMVNVELFGPTDSVKIFSLVDSGAWYCLFNVAYASKIGVDIAKCKKGATIGVGGMERIPVYYTELEMQVDHQDTIRIPVGFIDSPSVNGLLGQIGFFDSFRIKFERDHGTFEITRVKTK